MEGTGVGGDLGQGRWGLHPKPRKLRLDGPSDPPSQGPQPQFEARRLSPHIDASPALLRPYPPP